MLQSLFDAKIIQIGLNLLIQIQIDHISDVGKLHQLRSQCNLKVLDGIVQQSLVSLTIMLQFDLCRLYLKLSQSAQNSFCRIISHCDFSNSSNYYYRS